VTAFADYLRKKVDPSPVANSEAGTIEILTESLSELREAAQEIALHFKSPTRQKLEGIPLRFRHER
tara:strand:+ start:20 stop:217 length:198 start_codon:yes stop_codon:yes gene_type:complete